MNKLEMKLGAAPLFFILAFAVLPAQAQGPGGPPAGAGQSLASQVANLTARVAKLEGQIAMADLAGTYALHGFQVELIAGSVTPPNPNQVASYVFVGTVVLAGDGTATISGTENGSRLFFPPPSLSPDQAPPFSQNTTWSYTGGTVTISVGGNALQLSVAAGGRLLVHASANHSDGTNVLLLLTRLQ